VVKKGCLEIMTVGSADGRSVFRQFMGFRYRWPRW